jgi:hypothetical protein
MKETRRERRGPLAALLLVVCCLLGTAWSCARKGGAFGPSGEGSAAVDAVARPEPTQAPGAVVAGRRAVPGLPLFEDHTVGAPFVSGNLAVFPVYASVQEDVGEIVTLDEALEKGTAEVREVGPEAVAGEQVREVQQRTGEGAVVNTLVIENRGKQPILVLAGTILKGGKQDRQVGRDFLVGANETEPVDAFCIEHNRWTTVRDGLATGGKFRAMKVLAVGEVRGAGQYEGDQGQGLGEGERREPGQWQGVRFWHSPRHGRRRGSGRRTGGPGQGDPRVFPRLAPARGHRGGWLMRWTARCVA